jgi:2-oxoglutarate ferredoxin oxidoreductase subunit gamma
MLGEAAVLYEGVNATQNQSYGIQARGGECRSEVIISDEEINYAEIEQPDVLLAMSQSALNAYGGKIKENGVVIVDAGLVEDLSSVKNTGNIFRLPITEISLEKTKKVVLANVVALGVLSALTGVVSKKSLERVILKRAPAGTEELNLLALSSGVLAAEKFGKDTKN